MDGEVLPRGEARLVVGLEEVEHPVADAEDGEDDLLGSLHGPGQGIGQKSFVALSRDGIAFEALSTWMRGKHTIKTGINFSWLQAHLFNPQDALGIFAFDGSFTRNTRTLREGNTIADLLLGYPFQAQTSTFAYMNQRFPFYDFYVQDEWRVNERLTLNLGLRYELHLPWVETRNLWSNFDIDTDLANPALVPAKKGSRAAPRVSRVP